jgi:hypothetical protein
LHQAERPLDASSSGRSQRIDLGLAYPKVDAAKRKELAAARAALTRER